MEEQQIPIQAIKETIADLCLEKKMLQMTIWAQSEEIKQLKAQLQKGE